MKPIRFVLFGFLLVLIQTTAIPFSIPGLQRCDLILLLIVYLGMYHQLRDTVPAALVVGYAVDTLSSAPLGIYVSVYTWTLLAVHWTTNVLHVGSRLMVVIMPMVGLTVVNLLFWPLLRIAQPDYQIPQGVCFLLAKQFLVLLVMGPLCVILFEWIYKQLDRWLYKFRHQQKSQA